jgi:hypothetical protein
MSDTARPTMRNTRTLLRAGIACTVIWVAMTAIFRAEEGTGADITWLVSTLVALTGLIAFALAGRAAMLNRR